MEPAAYQQLAAVFEHPSVSFGETVATATDTLRGPYPRAAACMEEFQALVPNDDLIAMQELHTRTFDVQAITTLDIGYTLFGEDYKRGALLANLSAEHKKADNDCGAELGDHLTNLLRLLPKIADEELRAELVQVILAPALRQMIRDFEPARVTKKEELYKKHHKTLIEHAPTDLRFAYCRALEALYEVLRTDFSLRVGLPLEQASAFERGVEVELGIEDNPAPCAPT